MILFEGRRCSISEQCRCELFAFMAKALTDPRSDIDILHEAGKWENQYMVCRF